MWSSFGNLLFLLPLKVAEEEKGSKKRENCALLHEHLEASVSFHGNASVHTPRFALWIEVKKAFGILLWD